jgi:dienelactone hydrolase
MRRTCSVLGWSISCTLLCWSSSAAFLSGGENNIRRGEVQFALQPDEANVPERFRLTPHVFDFAAVRLESSTADTGISLVTFPSPVKTDLAENNTVHCEFYLPQRKEKVPAVVVLHILGGDFPLSRFCCSAMASRGVAALFVKMPYYGPRRVPGNPRRMVSKDPQETVEGMTQAVLDIRRAAAFLAAQPEIDGEQLGVFGVSLGGITGGLAATAEPRFKNVCLLLAGGDMGRIGWDNPELREVREKWLKNGGTRESFFDLMKQVDPVSYADRARGKRILMLNAKTDEIIPRACTESLWKAFGEPEIVWYDGGHYTVARSFFSILDKSTGFFVAK